MKKVFFSILFLNLLLFGWDLKKNEDGIKVYTQDVKKSKYDEFKAVTEINASFEKVKQALLDFKSYPRWQKKIDEIEVRNGYMYKRLDFPFPLSDRFAFYKIEVNGGNDELRIEFKSIPYEKLPENVKSLFQKPLSGVEMEDRVLFTAMRLPNGKVKVEYSALVDPKGVPAFIFNSKIVEAGYKTLINLKEYIQK